LAADSPVNEHVSSMVDAMASFMGSGDGGKASVSGATELATPTPQGKDQATPLAVGSDLQSMVDAMRQFNANGQSTPAASVPTTLNTTLTQEPSSYTLASAPK
jgi:hypothetical protein